LLESGAGSAEPHSDDVRPSGAPEPLELEEASTVSAATGDRQIRLDRLSSSYWRATLDLPPLNIFGPDSIPQLEAIVGALERDPHVKVVVFDSAVEGFFLTHCDFLADLEESTSLPPGPTGLPPLPDMLVRLSRAPVVSIASIRGRATGVGSELALACEPRNGSSRQRACRPKPTSLRSGMHSSIPYSVPPPRPGSRR
jgi:hypothetical protein